MKTNNSIDKQLVEAFQSGDKEALATLVKRWHILFCKKAYWLVKDADLSKDIAQDSWQVIISRIDTLKDPSRFSSWAFRIVYSKSLDVLRNRSRTQERLRVYKNEQVIYDDVYDEKTSIKKELSIAIQSLPESQRVVLKLFYMEKQTLKEISKTLKTSVGTTKSRLFHAREKLKLILKNKDYEK